MTTAPSVTVAVEGESDRGMAEAVVARVGFTLRRCVVKNGVGNLDKLIDKLAATTLNEPWIIFRDSDRVCPVVLRGRLVGDRPGARFALRLVRPMTEAWLMVDAAGFAQHFRVRRLAMIPDAPEERPDPKDDLLRVCQSARRHDMMVRPDGAPGPWYVQGLNTFAREAWDVDRARERSPSLDRAIARLEAMRRGLG